MKRLLITGGTGTLAKSLIPIISKSAPDCRIRVLSRGEHSQIKLQEKFKHYKIDWFIGDVRDLKRVVRASKGCHYVFHLAAFKSVDKAEMDPWESVLTNVNGTQNLIEACIENKVEKAIFTSTDKAVDPVLTYGATKLLAEKLWIHGNIGDHKTRFAAVRYGNVLASAGSVVEKWISQLIQNKVTITNPNMTRFFITPQKAAEFVFNCFAEMKGGEIFIPKMNSCYIKNLAEAWQYIHNPEQLNIQRIPSRPSEKINEALYSAEQADLVTETDTKFIEWPAYTLFPFIKYGKPVLNRGQFNSGVAKKFKKAELEEMLCDAYRSLQI